MQVGGNLLDRLIARPHNADARGDGTLDLGLLAEQLLFYGEVRLHAGPGQVQAFIAKLGPDLFKRLLELPFFRFHYVETGFGVQTNADVHAPVVFRIGNSDGSPAWDPTKVVEKAVRASGRVSRGLERDIVRLLNVEAHDEELVAAAASDFETSQWIQTGARIVLASSGVPSTAKFTTEKVKGGVRVHTDVDFTRLRRHDGSPLTVAHVLAELAEFRRTVLTAARFNSELLASSVEGRLLEAKASDLLGVAQSSASQLDAFQESAFGDAKAIREAINTGRLPFEDFLGVLESSRRFKKWVAEQSPDEALLREYIKEVSHQEPFERLPGKTARFLFFAGGSIIAGLLAGTVTGILAGAALDAIDTFLFDSLVKKWSPGAFVADLDRLLEDAR